MNYQEDTEQQGLISDASQPENEAGMNVSAEPPKANSRAQLKLSKRERDRIGRRIEEDYANAISDHQSRMERFTSYYLRWRSRVGMEGGADAKSNFSVPLVKSQVFLKWAKEIDALLGDDAEIVSVPTGPADQANVAMQGRYMTWRVFKSMNITSKLAVFIFRKNLFGRAHAYAPYQVDTFDVPGDPTPQIDFDGPGFEPEWPDDIITPAEDARTIHDFSYVIRRLRPTLDQLRDGEDKGIYSGITDNWEAIYRAMESNSRTRDHESEGIKKAADAAEGVLYEGSLSGHQTLEVWEWYGRRRLLKGRGDGGEDNFARREKKETEIVVRYIKDLQLVIGAQRLADIYPRMSKRRPFVEASMVKDGTYWGPGLGELLEDVETELTVVDTLTVEAGEMTIGPPICYQPGDGFDPDTFRYEPRMAIPMGNPNNVRVLDIRPNLEYAVMRKQDLMAMAERLTGQTDQNVGRQPDRPNSPRTLGQTQLYLAQGDVRGSLETFMLREDLRLMLQHFWEIDCEYASSAQFFRVTEEQAKGLFQTSQGGATMTQKERAGKMDFDLRFATSTHSREAVKQQKLQLYQVDLANPLIQSNSTALWHVTNEAHKAMGDDNFNRLVPQPPDTMPKTPDQEWALALQAQEIFVHPQDIDDQHLQRHLAQVFEASQAPQQDRDPDAIAKMLEHIKETQAAKIEKQQAQAMANALAPMLGQLMGGAQQNGPPAASPQPASGAGEGGTPNVQGY
jgi:hypothetical protein